MKYIAFIIIFLILSFGMAIQISEIIKGENLIFHLFLFFLSIPGCILFIKIAIKQHD
jgi:hypothetical protein